MDRLEALVKELTELATRNCWREILAEDERVRGIINEVLATSNPADKKRAAESLRTIQNIYREGAAQLESGQGQSATEIKSIQKGLRAARSYLDNTRF